ncbi:hypothetical protein L3Q82_025287 [Scortum barcoo]|uniref:Uncharacterized protein n=1 Tax=Scortum barcoo TaxID=214431 RepID=A0ACB8WRU9_9TELE|nr:hypothetical protein L3Q82_025287 [Scortum barcoo]
MIDFVVVSSDLRPYVLDTRVKRGAELSTDHHLVELGGLQLPPPEELLTDSEGGWETLSPSGPCSLPPLSTRGGLKLWTQVSGACRGSNPRTQWWTPEVRDCRQAEEGVLSRTMLACGTPDAVDRYRQAKQAAAQRSWRQKLGSGRSSVRPWRRTIGRPPEENSGKPSGASEGGSSTLPCQHCLQCRWGAVDLDWGHCRTVVEEMTSGSPQSHHRLAFQ